MEGIEELNKNLTETARLLSGNSKVTVEISVSDKGIPNRMFIKNEKDLEEAVMLNEALMGILNNAMSLTLKLQKNIDVPDNKVIAVSKAIYKNA